MMNAYLVKLVFQISIEHHVGPAQFDEQLRLVNADDMSSAWEKANRLGLDDEIQFVCQSGQPVHWKFICTTDVFPLQAVGDGGQVCSHTHEVPHADRFIEEMHLKARLAGALHTETTRNFV